MTHYIAGMAGKAAGNMLGFGKQPNYEAMSEDQAKKEFNKRRRRKLYTLGGAALVLTTGAMSLNGYIRGLERNPAFENESTGSGGSADIVSFDAAYEAHCWTATTIQVNGAGIKDEAKALGVTVADKWTKVDFQTDNNQCMNSTMLKYVVNTKTGHVDIHARKEDFYTNTSIVYGSIKPSSDQSLSYAFADNTINMMESLPFIEDSGLSKDLSKGQDAQNASAINTALLIGSEYANAECLKQTVPLTRKPIEEGIKNLASLGLRIAKVRYDAIDPTDISVLVDGEPISQMDSISDKSNISDAYAKLKKFDDENDNFSILPPSEGTCKPSKQVQDQLDAALAAGK